MRNWAVPADAHVLRTRWRRFQRDLSRCVNWRVWILAILAPTAVSSALLFAWSLQSEKEKNQLLVRFAQERINQASQSLTAETKDYAIWDETNFFLLNANSDYIQKNFNSFTFARTPIVAFFNRRGDLVAAYHFDNSRQRIEPLPPNHRRDLRRLVSDSVRAPGESHTFIGSVAGRPYLLSLQSVFPTSGKGATSGQLLFVRDIDTFQSYTLYEAVGILSESFEASRPLRSSLFGPLKIDIPHPQLLGDEPIQHLVIRRPMERLQALKALLLLLGFDLLLLAVIAARSYTLTRKHLFEDLQLMRRERHLSRNLRQRDSIDSLTGLLSESGLIEAISGQRQMFPQFLQLALHVDLDHFAFMTTGIGRSGGDTVLRGVAMALERNLHPSSRIARLSADEFACSIIGTSEAALLSDLSELSQTINQLEIPVDGHHPVSISASIGASFVDSADPNKALHEASVACRITRMAGGAAYQVYGEAHGATSTYLAIQRTNEELLAALRDDRIKLYAQHAWSLEPADALRSVYVELLARIEDRDDQHCYWSEAIVEAATYCGSLKLLDLHVLDRALPAISNVLRQRPAGCTDLVYAVNVSADVLLTDNFASLIDRQLEHHGLDPGMICMELTEQAALRNPAKAITTLKRLHKMGVRLAMDDFGTGTTSLGYLRDLPLDYVKIDKTFIWKLRQDPSCRLIVQFVVQIGKEIGFSTIAEGVEDAAMLRELQDLGVSIAQGYVVTKPQPFGCADNQWIFAAAGGGPVRRRRPAGLQRRRRQSVDLRCCRRRSSRSC